MFIATPSLSEPMDLLQITRSTKLVIQFKLSSFGESVDLRVWKKWVQDGEYHPSNNGIFIRADVLRQAMPKIKALLDTQVSQHAI